MLDLLKYFLFLTGVVCFIIALWRSVTKFGDEKSKLVDTAAPWFALFVLFVLAGFGFQLLTEIQNGVTPGSTIAESGTLITNLIKFINGDISSKIPAKTP